jgi:hypothetical protein
MLMCDVVSHCARRARGECEWCWQWEQQPSRCGNAGRRADVRGRRAIGMCCAFSGMPILIKLLYNTIRIFTSHRPSEKESATQKTELLRLRLIDLGDAPSHGCNLFNSRLSTGERHTQSSCSKTYFQDKTRYSAALRPSNHL